MHQLATRTKQTKVEINQKQNARLREWRKNPEWLAHHNAKKREWSKATLERAKSDPEALAALRLKRRSANQKWIEKMRTLEPARHEQYLKRQWESERLQRRNNPQRHISCVLRTKTYIAIRRQQAGKKTFNTIELTGCSIAELMKQVEAQWEPDMSWVNFGRGIGKWSLDHKRPCASFDLRDPAQQKEAFHFSNIQPMWFTENCSKNSHWNNKKWQHSDHACQPALAVQTPTP